MKRERPFRALAAQRGICPPVFTRHIDAMEAAVLLDEISSFGDLTLLLKDKQKLSTSAAEELLEGLLAAFSDPMGNSTNVAKASSKLREFEL